jgi:hypothetical protein
MKYFVLCCAALIAFTASAQAGFGVHGNLINSKLNNDLRLIAGQQLPAGSSSAQVVLEDVYGMGYGGGIHIDVDLPILLSLRLSGDYVTLSPDKDKFTAFIRQVAPGVPIEFSEGGRVNIISGTVNLKLNIIPLPIVKPYVTGGGGVANITSTEVKLLVFGQPYTVKVLKDQTVGTANAGVGVDLSFGGLSLFGEVKLTWLFIEGGTATYVPIGTVGLTF